MTMFVAIILAFGSFQQLPADSVNLQYCYKQAAENYPTAKKVELQKEITDLNVEIANTGYFPELTFNGEASYQSEVTEFSLPGSRGLPSVSKDQYETSVNVRQNIFNSGAVGIRKKLEREKGRQQIYTTEVELHKVRSQINKVYFGILLSQQQGKTNNLFLEDLQKRLETVRSQVQNGTLLASQQQILEAEIIKARQDSADIQANTRAGYQVLSELIGEEMKVDINLRLPEINIHVRNMQPQRPEYDLFQQNRSVIEWQKELAKTNKLPSISAFGTAAYGRPGLNFLDDDFHDYYIVGVRMRWNFWDFFNSDREQQVLKIQQQKITQNKRAFTKQLNVSLDRIRERISTIKENIDRDKEIIKLRNQVVAESKSQLANGTITSTEYVTELTNARQAKLSLLTNRVRLVQAQAEYATMVGLPTNKIFKDENSRN